MERKEGERGVVGKPVASRPTCRSFSDLLAGGIKASPSNTCSGTIITAIRPKSVRLKPMANHVPHLLLASENRVSGDTLSNSFEKPYKPQAKLVSKPTLSLLANMGTTTNEEKEKEKIGCSSPVIMGNGDRPSYDGYNWRKYGQKQVKGSEYPRSYYKCTHPSCPVKKKVERSFDGKIAEIVYKGEHNHPKPQPPKQPSLLGSTPPNNPSSISNQLTQTNQITVQNHNEIPTDISCGLAAEFEEGNNSEPKSKRRRKEKQEVGTSGQDPQVMTQGSTDSEILGDGFRWRKYGQKVVKGNSYPRSYYRCTSPKCNVRKHVERASDDPTAFITTYEGKHNHEMPSRNVNNISIAEQDSTHS